MALSYTPTTWVDGSTAADQANLNNIESGVNNATNQINTNTSAIAVRVVGSGFYSGFTLFVGPNTPTGMVKGDVWIKTPFS